MTFKYTSKKSFFVLTNVYFNIRNSPILNKPVVLKNKSYIIKKKQKAINNFDRSSNSLILHYFQHIEAVDASLNKVGSI